MRKDWEELANKHKDCRVFIEFAEAHRELFAKWLAKEVQKSIKQANK